MYRSTDPITSVRAAMELIADGVLQERQAQVLALVMTYDRFTHGELAAKMYQEYPTLGILCCAESPHKRLPELQRKGLVWPLQERRCRETGKDARVWTAVNPHPQFTFEELNEW